MTEQRVTLETAKLAKEKGFDIESCRCGGFPDCICTDKSPTQSLLQKWLREQNKIIVSVNYGFIDDSTDAFHWTIITENPNSKSDFDRLNNIESFSAEYMEWHHTYELALEKGLQEALKLIP